MPNTLRLNLLQNKIFQFIVRGGTLKLCRDKVFQHDAFVKRCTNKFGYLIQNPSCHTAGIVDYAIDFEYPTKQMDLTNGAYNNKSMDQNRLRSLGNKKGAMYCNNIEDEYKVKTHV